MDKFTITHPGNMTAGTRLGYSVSRSDVFGNAVSAGATPVHLYTNSLATTTMFFNAASGGTQITSLNIGVSSTAASFWYFNKTPGNYMVTVSDNSTVPDGATGIADDADALQVLSSPIVATKFVLSVDTDTLGTGETANLTIAAEDNAGNIDTTIQSSMTLILSGAAQGGGVITLVNGVATVPITDGTAQTVTASLSDTAGTGLNTNAILVISFLAPAQVFGGGGGSSGPITATLSFSGQAFPSGIIKIFTLGQGSIPVSQNTVPASGSFSIDFSGILPGSKLYGLQIIDPQDRTSQTKLYQINVQQPTAIQQNISLPPTLGIVRTPVTQGTAVGFEGYAVPGAAIEASVDGTLVKPTGTADSTGYYKILYNTASLALGSHKVRVRQINSDGTRSDYSLLISFNVTKVFISVGDLNGDGVVDARDVSIFVSRYYSKDPTVRITLDLNNDGKVDIEDVGIFAQSIGK